MGRVELVLVLSPLAGSPEPSWPFQLSWATGCSSAIRRPYIGSDGATGIAMMTTQGVLY